MDAATCHSICDLRVGRRACVEAKPFQLAAPAWGVCVYPTAVPATRHKRAAGVCARVTALDQARWRCRQDARLPCRRVVANATGMDLSIIILNYNTCAHL